MSLVHAILRNRLLAPPQNEVRLMHHARAAYASLDFGDLTTEVLARIARERGVDFATCLLYDRIRCSSVHGAFIRDLESLEPDPGSLPSIHGKVLVVPAGFYREHPEFGGDGRLVREIA